MNVRAVVWPLVAACLVAGLDQGVKLMVPSAKPDLPLIPGFFAIRFARGTRARPSVSAGFPEALAAVGVAILAGLLFYLWKRASAAPGPERIGLSVPVGWRR